MDLRISLQGSTCISTLSQNNTSTHPSRPIRVHFYLMIDRECYRLLAEFVCMLPFLGANNQ